MSFVITGAAIGVVGAGTSIYRGIKQSSDAKKIRKDAIDPGIQNNYALDRVNSTLYQNYANYNLPGYSKIADQIGSNQASSNATLVNSATSSADILNGITNNQIAADASISQLGITAASGKERALMSYLDSVNSQGQDQLRVNELERGRYDARMREASALEGASIQNFNNGFQDVLTSGSALVGNFTPRQTVDQTTGQIISMPSVWEQMYGKKRNDSFIQNYRKGYELR